jgi:cyclophilin family peptidyl-prolyl cis-trans isomerase
LPLHLFIPELRRLAAALLLLLPLGALAQDAALPDGLYAEITTPRGVITCELDYARVPLVVANFVGLAEGTLGPAPRRPFFDGLKFHRVVAGFVIQGGDPLGTGEGGPGYEFPDQFSPSLSHDRAGVLSMANDGPDTNGSQFFITLAAVQRLDFLHSVFGRTVKGSDVPARIVQGDAMQVRILRVGKAARDFKADQTAFDALSAATQRYSAEKEPGPKAHFDDPDKLLPTDAPRAQNFNYKLANFERATGLRIYGRVFAKFVPSSLGETPDGAADKLRASLGIGDNGALAVYFSDTGKWSLSLGKVIAEKLSQAASGAHEPSKYPAFASSIDMFFTNARAREAAYTAQTTASLPNFLQMPGGKLKLSVDAILDELIVKASL